MPSNGVRLEAPSGRMDAAAEPIYFGRRTRELFAWLHSPAQPAGADLGLVICKPFGYEAICSHRSVRTLAQTAANLGFPALRFDYSGTGDSAELEPQTDQLITWTDDVACAVAELRKRSGVSRVCVIGVRLGALLAMRLAIENPSEIEGLVLVSPVLVGRRYLRELRMTRLASMLGAESVEEAPKGDDPDAPPADFLEVSGFLLSRATLATLAQCDLNATQPPQTANLLVIDSDSLAASQAWVDAAASTGAKVVYRKLPGLVQMLATSPQFAQTPPLLIPTICEWIGAWVRPPHPARGPDAEHPAAGDYGAFRSAPNVSMACGEAGSAFTERPVYFGSDGLLFGIVSEPQSQERRRRAVVLLNAGADYHIGASGMYVSIARRWVRRGYVVLRMDLAGLGDSGTRRGRQDEDVFPPAAIDDIRAAVELMRESYGARDITLAGLCSGAYHALRAAILEVPVNRILLMNPQNYFWKEGMSVSDMQAAEVVRYPGLYRDKLFSLVGWKKLISGQVNLVYVAKIFANRVMLGAESLSRDIARALHLRLAGDLGWQLKRITSRGVRVVFIFARLEPGIALLKLQAGSYLEDLGDLCRVHVLETGDHVFSKHGSRAVLQELLDKELFSERSTVDDGLRLAETGNNG